MPIKFKEIKNDCYVYEMFSFKPTVYLDNWALNQFIRMEDVGNKFITLLNNKNGTLAMSYIGLYEIINRKDKNQILKISQFVDKIDCVFFDANSKRVIRKEKNGIVNFSPCLSEKFMETCALYSGNPTKPLNVSQVILKMKNEIDENPFVYNEQFEEQLMPLINKIRKDTKAFKLSQKRFKSKIKKRDLEKKYTEEIDQFFIDFIVNQKNITMQDKEWRDMFHIIVPLAYCDFVLLDKRWLAFAKCTGLKYPDIAKTYSQRNIDEFFNNLNEF